MENYDLIAIGDITNDAFIKLSEKNVGTSLNADRTELCLGFGEKLPYEFIKELNAVGNCPNAVSCAEKLGLKTALVSNLGDDENGQKCLRELEKKQIGTEFISIHQNHRTNYNFILWFESDRTILVKHENYEYHLPNLKKSKWIYLSSIGESAESYYQEISEYLDKNPETKLAFQPGTFQIKFGKEKFINFYKRAELLAVNKNEAQKILNADKSTEVKDLLLGLKELGPKIVIITDGENGAYLLSPEKEFLFAPVYPNKEKIIDRTGAGDAFTATFIAYLIKGKSLEEALIRAPINSRFVMTQIGAQEGLLDSNKIESLLETAPKEYALKKI